MRSLDTNILVRFLVGDDPKQSQAAREVVEDAERRREPLFVSLLVVLELIWVLESAYDCSRAAVLDALDRLTAMEPLRFEAVERVQEAIRLGRNGSLGLPDLLIGLTARDLGCETTLTFDKRAARSGLFSPMT